MRRLLTILTILALATGCQAVTGGSPGAPAQSLQTGSLQLTLRVPPEALPGYQTATIPGGAATIVALLSNGGLLGAPRSTTVTLVPAQTLYTVTLNSLPVGAGYTLEAEARNGSGARLAYTNQLDPTSIDPVLGQLKTVNPFTNPPQSFAISSGVNNINAGLRVLALSGNTQGATAGGLTGNTQVATGYKKTLTITSASTASVGYACTLALNTSALVTATKLRADMADLHVLYWDGAKYTELYRDIENPNTASSLIRFRLQKQILPAGNDANYLLTYGNNMAAAAPSDRAQVYDFYDGFEYASSELEARGWTTLSGTGTAATAAGQGRSGNALSLNSNLGDFNRDLVHYLDFPADFSMVAWFKDDMDATRHDWMSPSVAYISSAALGVDTRVATSFYHFIPFGGSWQSTPVARTGAWHCFEYRRVNGTMSYLVDGSTAGTATDGRIFKAITVRCGIPGTPAISSTATWDDVSVRQIMTPDPVVTPGSEQSL